jgi:type I restriction-modification system DNA methylase subunit
MSEELTQRGLNKNGIIIVDYEFFPLHSTTLKQYRQAKIIPNIDYGKYEIRRPDGLLVDRLNKSNSMVVAVLEYKQPIEFQTDKQKKEATEQCNDLCQVLGAKMGIITDGIATYWINPNHADKNNYYLDRTTGKKRSYSFILNDDKQRLQKNFLIKEQNQTDINKLDEGTKETYQIIKRILQEVDGNNSVLKATEKTDPSSLARSVWQSIYISTKDNPTACLYNVVEIFIFKFLSDLGVLKGVNSFNYLLDLYKKEDSKTVLKHYAKICRPEIRNLFEEGADGTTIINGTIFVNKDGTPVLSQATLFKDTVEKYAKFGDLKNIKKEFKTKLFETFLKQSKDKSKLGQFLTPRKVIRAIVEMADIDKANFICDPFCGVGGFVLEPFQVSSNLKNKFSPKNGKISSPVRLLGYDSGREDNEEQRRTIILAKANMLIYLSDLVEKNPNLNKEFAKLFNSTFHFLSDSNLGTLKEKFDNEEDKPDLILTNPPYITSGVGTIRKQIEEEGLSNFYANSGKGVEGLCLKWIIENLRRGGSAFIILPDGIFNVFANKVLRDEIKKQCFINCIISLPVKTFFNTPKKTYILGITKKEDDAEKQNFPVFTYLASNIGETLNINRFDIPDNDLDKAKILFKQYKASPNDFKTDDLRCKLQSIEKFEKEKYWIIDKWWSKKEKERLGVLEKEQVLTIDEFKEKIENSQSKLGELEKITDLSKSKTKSVLVLDLFDPKKGNSKYTKKYMHDHRGEYPVYSSQTSNLGEIGEIDSYDYEEECFTWTTDGTYVGTVFYRNGKFSITTHCGILKLKDEYRGKVNFEYLSFILNSTLPNYTLGEGSNKRLGTERMSEISIEIPIKQNGDFDLEKQKEIADNYEKIEQIKEKLKEDYEEIINSRINLFEN